MTKESVLVLYEHYKKIGYASAQLDIEVNRPWVLDSNAAETAKIDFSDEAAKTTSRAKRVTKVVEPVETVEESA